MTARDDRGGPGAGSGGRAPRGRGTTKDGRPLATYRIDVGRRHKVEPRQIVGALANEGGLRRQDFGAIAIRPAFSLVELPADLPTEIWSALSGTRISGKLIGLRLDDGPRAPRPSSASGAPRTKKPRHKKRP